MAGGGAVGECRLRDTTEHRGIGGRGSRVGMQQKANMSIVGTTIIMGGYADFSVVVRIAVKTKPGHLQSVLRRVISD